MGRPRKHPLGEWRRISRIAAERLVPFKVDTLEQLPAFLDALEAASRERGRERQSEVGKRMIQNAWRGLAHDHPEAFSEAAND